MMIGRLERLKEVMPDIAVHDSHNFLGFNRIFIFSITFINSHKIEPRFSSQSMSLPGQIFSTIDPEI